MAVADGSRAAAKGDRLVTRRSVLSCWSVGLSRTLVGAAGGAITHAQCSVYSVQLQGEAESARTSRHFYRSAPHLAPCIK